VAMGERADLEAREDPVDREDPVTAARHTFRRRRCGAGWTRDWLTR
jgi:hypothetical protein